MKKILSLCMALIMLLGMCGIASAETAAFNEAPYKIVELDQNDPAYWQTEWEAQVYNYKMVRNFPTLYEKDAWDAAQNTGSLMMNIHPDALTDANKEQILAAKAAIDDLKNHQLKPFSDGINGEVIYIWGSQCHSLRWQTQGGAEYFFDLIMEEKDDNRISRRILFP